MVFFPPPRYAFYSICCHPPLDCAYLYVRNCVLSIFSCPHIVLEWCIEWEYLPLVMTSARPHDVFPLKDLSHFVLNLYIMEGCHGYHYVVEKLPSCLTSLFWVQNKELMDQLNGWLSSSHTSVCFIVEIHLLLFLVFGNMFVLVFVFLILWVSRFLFLSFFFSFLDSKWMILKSPENVQTLFSGIVYYV